MAVPGVDEAAMNRAIDPCADFYEFACGGYIASLPSDTRRDVRSFTQLQKDQNALLDRILEAIRQTPQNDAERKAAALHASCMAEDGAARGAEYVARSRAEIEAATTPGAIAELLARFHRRGVAAFFMLSPTRDTDQVGRVGTAVAYAAQHADYPDDTARRREIAKSAATLKGVEPALTDEEATRLATAAVRIDEALSRLDGTANAWPGADHHQRPHLVGRQGLEIAAPRFDWHAYFTTLGRADFGAFPVEDLGFFSGLDELFATADPADIRAYLRVRWYGVAARYSAPPADRASFCRSQVRTVMADAIESRFLELAGVDARARAKARALWSAVVEAFGRELREETFLDAPTRIEALVKLEKMRGAIGASRRLDDFAGVAVNASDTLVENRLRLRERSFDRGLAQIGRELPLLHVDFPAPTVNASYDPSLNKINIPGGILGGYFFSGTASPLANFAAIGTVLGHELTHGFDDWGRQVDGNGVSRDWWSPAVDTAFQTRARCMIDQYGAFTLPDVVDPLTGQTPAHVNGETTLGENIADNGGIKTAYRASRVEGMTAPIAFGFTPQQQFFIGYAQLWCGKTAPDLQAEYLVSDAHSPSKARVNVPLSNFEAFGRAFSCARTRAGTTMATANRCEVW